jgi:hypothetical protein
MRVLICSACLNKIVLNLVKDSCISLIKGCSCVLFAVIVAVSILSLVAWAYLGVCHFRSPFQFSVVLQGFFSLVSVYL